MKTHYEYLIIGAGPAGVQMSYFFEKNGRDYLILEHGDKPGQFFAKYPRHRNLISINKVNTGKSNPELNLRWDWNSLLSDNPDLRFPRYSDRYFPNPDVLLKYIQDFVNYYGINIQYNFEVKRIAKSGDQFVVTNRAGETFTSDRLILATGFTKENIPNIPGIEHVDTYGSHSLDKSEYLNKRVLIIGKGNSAFETAEYLTETAANIHVCSPNSLTFAWQTHYVGNLRAVNNNFLDTYQLKSQNTVIDASVTRIEKIADQYLVHLAYTHAKGQTRINTYDKIISCTGFKFDDSIFDESCKPETAYNGKFPAQTEEWQSVNIPGMYIAGTLMHACDFKRTMSGFIHGFRHNIEALSNILEYKYHGKPFPFTTTPLSAENVLQMALDRFNNGSSIFLQPGFLCDVIVVDEQSSVAKCYPGMRKQYVPLSPLGNSEHYYTLSLEYGHFHGDPFAIERDPDPDKANEASYLHPIIRRFNQGELVSEFHIQDDLENEWYLDEYVLPARAYFYEQFSKSGERTPIA